MTRGRFLILDDDGPSRIVVGRALKRLGYEVDAAASAAEAQRFVEGNGPAAYVGVVADFRMPQVSGLEFLEWLHGVDASLAALLLSAQQDLESDQWRKQPGVHEVMMKPIDFERFTAVAGELVAHTVQARAAAVQPH